MAGLAGERIRTEDTALALSPYVGIVSRSTNLSCAHGSFTTLTWTTEDLDTDGLYTSASSTSRFTIQHAGLYVAHLFTLFDSSNDYTRFIAQIRVNGGEYSAQEERNSSYPFYGGRKSVDSGLMQLSASDYVDCAILHNNGASAARNLSSGRFTILYVGDGS